MRDHHPAAALFPLMDNAALHDLAEDIRAHGLIEPIVLLDEQVLDGRNRLRACETAGVEPRFVEWEGVSSPTEYVLSANLHRRHLTHGQRAALALDLLPKLEAEARERQREHGGTAPGRMADTSSDNGRSDEKAAELVGIGRSAVAYAKAIQNKKPEVIDRLRSGELTIARASREAGFEAMGQGGNGHHQPISDDEPSVHYGKGDKWREASIPLKRYLAAWRGRGFEFRHIAPREATKRLATIDELIQGLTEARADIERRSHRARLTV